MKCQFAAINFCVYLACLISYIMTLLNFCSDIFSQKYLFCEYRENKSLNRFYSVFGNVLLCKRAKQIVVESHCHKAIESTYNGTSL